MNATAEVFQEHQRLLFGIAYRMLGSAVDAEDMVQESYLRWRDVDAATVASPRAYLSTVVTRLCIDELRSARARREQYVGPWLPEPLVGEGWPGEEEGMEADVARADSISMAFLVLLETLSPSERAAFLLHDVFDFPYADVAEALERSEASCRQLASRARGRLAERKPRFEPPADDAVRLTERFLEAARDGDMEGLLALLSEDVTVWSDGGGKAAAPPRPIRGAEAVARFILGIYRTAPPGMEVRMTTVNAMPGVVTYHEGRPVTVGAVETGGGKIRAIRLVRNPDKLARVPPQPSVGG